MKILIRAIVTSLLIQYSYIATAQDNVHFSGALVSEPCTLPDADTAITLDFEGIVDKFLYANGRTPAKEFTIHLEDCDTSISDSMSITFQGRAEPELPTMLAMDAGSTVQGIAVGLERADGSPVSINKQLDKQSLRDGENLLVFNAYIQATPTSIAAKSIEPGNFVATSTFLITYE